MSNIETVYTMDLDWMESTSLRTMTRADVRSNLGRVKVYYRNFKATVIKEEAKYADVLALFVSLGGALSVWMGFSFIFFIEVSEAAFFTFRRWCFGKSRD